VVAIHRRLSMSSSCLAVSSFLIFIVQFALLFKEKEKHKTVREADDAAEKRDKLLADLKKVFLSLFSSLAVLVSFSRWYLMIRLARASIVRRSRRRFLPSDRRRPLCHGITWRCKPSTPSHTTRVLSLLTVRLYRFLLLSKRFLSFLWFTFVRV